MRTLLRHELCRLERQAGADLITGERLAAVAFPPLTGAPKGGR